ncbi:cytochrome c6 PetJ [Gloeothece verrucosa]|nr:c-type cytochrome [Gloeothece verrucosa]
MIKKIVILAMVLLIQLGSLPEVGLASEIGEGAKIFNTHCAGCHPNGNNIIRRGKTLQARALKKYKMDSLEAISNLVANGKNNMSAFKERLSEQEIKTVAQYVLEQAPKNWR